MSVIKVLEKQLADKQKGYKKNAAELPKMESKRKAAARDREEMREAAEKERDKKKKDKMLKEVDKLTKEFERIAKMEKVMQGAVEKFEENIRELREKIVEAKAGQAAFGKARADYLQWFAREKPKLDKLLEAAVKGTQNATLLAQTAESDSKSGNVEGAKAAARDAARNAQAVKAAADKAEALIGTWASVWSKQRNLAPKDYGIDTEDTKKFDAITKQVYGTFKTGDAGRAKARECVSTANREAERANKMAEGGADNVDTFRAAMDDVIEAIGDAEKAYDKAFVGSWGGIVRAKGQRFKDEWNGLDRSDPGKVNRVLKIAEQAAAALPNVIDRARTAVENANTISTRETKRVPRNFHRALKPQLDQIRMGTMKLVSQLKKDEALFDTTMGELSTLKRNLDDLAKQKV